MGFSNEDSITGEPSYVAFSAVSNEPLGTFSPHVETSTPIRPPQKSGLCSPPTSRRRHRDSGYFSFASEMTREMSASYTRPSSPALLELEDIEDSVQKSRGRHVRSNSHESIFATADLSYERIMTSNTLTHRKSLDCLATELAWATEETGPLIQEPVLPQHTATQATSTQAQSLLNRLQSARRPFPSPLQGMASSPTVSTSTTSATTQSSTRQDVIILPGAQVNRSYNALRSAAAAQRLSPNISGSQHPGNSVFWRPNSDKGLPTNGRPNRSAKWASFVGWNSRASSTASKNEAPQLGNSSQKMQGQEADERPNAGTSVQLTTADEDLLREALA